MMVAVMLFFSFVCTFLILFPIIYIVENDVHLFELINNKKNEKHITTLKINGNLSKYKVKVVVSKDEDDILRAFSRVYKYRIYKKNRILYSKECVFSTNVKGYIFEEDHLEEIKNYIRQREGIDMRKLHQENYIQISKNFFDNKTIDLNEDEEIIEKGKTNNRTGKFKDVHEAFWFLEDHPDGRFNVDITVVKVNPKSGKIDDDEYNNVKVEYWLEGSNEIGVHDIDLECSGDTFEEALINMASKVYEKYGLGEKDRNIEEEILMKIKRNIY